ncbi:MAG: ParB/RepB/Spo0J family partition protein [Candidatus Margulisiibacteriota bacterium]
MNNSNKRGLGKGLGALIPQGSVFAGGRTILNIDPENIVANPRQPRTHFSKEALHELAESIKEQGVIEPILVRMRDGKYELIAGERRLRAAKLAELKFVPAIVKDFTDAQSLEIALIENLQREDLNAMDEAEGYARLASEFGMTQEDIAKRMGKSRSNVANMIRLLSLPKQIKESIQKFEISAGHARTLLSLEDAEKQLFFWKQIVSQKLSVRDTEILVTGKEQSHHAKKSGRKRRFTQNTELNHLVEQLTSHFATKVKIFGTPERGKIEVEYFSLEDLSRIFDAMMGNKKKEETPFIVPEITHEGMDAAPPQETIH